MLARWALPALRCRAPVMLMKRACYTTTSFKTNELGVAKIQLYGDDGRFRFDMDFYNYHGRDNDSPLIIYLPSLSSNMKSHRLKQSQEGENYISGSICPTLGKAFRVVCINYRWTRAFPFPFPLHDVMVGYDAIVKNLCSARTKVGVHGRWIGGTLATSLALTESNPGKIGYISTLVAHNAPLNFASLATDSPVAENYSFIAHMEHDQEKLLAIQNVFRIQKLMRTTLFSSPATCFDPFASPLLFLRNPGREIPEDFVSMEGDSSNFIPNLVELQSSQSIGTSSSIPPLQKLQGSRGVRTPPIRFPPKGSGLVIPKTLIQAETEGWESHQGRELVKLMKRSVLMYEMKENGDRSFGAEEEAENRVKFVLDTDPPGRTDYKKMNEQKEDRIVAWLEDAMYN